MVFETNGYGNIVIVEYINANNVVVRFEDGSTRKTYKSQILSGKVRNKNLPGPSNAKADPLEQITRLKIVHDNYYGYDRAVYTGAQDKIVITCYKHGDFEQTYSDHAYGKGCNFCARERTILGIKNKAGKNTANVISDFKQLNGDDYDYSSVEYVDSKTKLEIVCKKHGAFYQTYKVHMKGHGCPSCAAEFASISQLSNTQEYVQKCVEKLGDEYDYRAVDYTGGHNFVTIICKTHGPFNIRASSHLHQGSGCPTCRTGGYNPMKPGSLYVMKSGDLTKVGVTNRDVNARLKELNYDSGHEFYVVEKFLFEDGYACLATETRLLRYLRSKYKNPIKRFSGASECFFDVDRADFMVVVNQEVKRSLSGEEN
jgi:protein-arginine kinase activator protein McsA